MRALTVKPQTPNSLQVSEVSHPQPANSELLVRGIAVGVCGTDKEIVRGDYGWAPPGRDRLVLGHESLAGSRALLPEAGSRPAIWWRGWFVVPIRCRVAPDEWCVTLHRSFK